MRSCLSACFAALVLASAAVPAAAADAPATYELKAGDTLIEFALKYLRDPADYRAVQRVNRIRNPRRIPVGTELSVPYELLRIEPTPARLIAFRGQIRVESGGAQVTPQRGMALNEGAVLSTDANAFLTIEMADGSRTTLPSRSRLRIVRLRRVILTGAVEREFALEAGRSGSKVSPLANPRDQFQIDTPVAVAAVRGTDFRVAFNPDSGRSVLEVVEGKVADRHAASGAELLTNAGFGAVAQAQGLSEPIALLPAVKLRSPAKAQEDPELAFEVLPTPGAASYRAQLAYDAGLIDLFAEAESTTPTISLPSAPNGTYFVRITALDAAGIEGLPSVYAFERRLNSLEAGPPGPLDGPGRRFLFKWESSGEGTVTYRFQLSRKEDGSEALIDETGLTQKEIVVRDLPPGVYFWRVLVSRAEGGRVSERWSPPQRFELGG